MGTIASQITNFTIVYSTVYSDADQRKYLSSASLAIVWGIHRRPVNSPHIWPVTRKMCPFDDVIMARALHFTLGSIELFLNPKSSSMAHCGSYITFFLCELAFLFMGYSYFTIWHWKFKVNAIGVAIGRGHIVDPASIPFNYFSIRVNKTTHSWGTAISKFNIKINAKIFG